MAEVGEVGNGERVAAMFSGLRVHRAALPDGPAILGNGTLLIKVDKHFFIKGTKKERKAARKAGTPEVRYIAFNKSDATRNTADANYRYKAPLPAGATEGEMVEIQLKDAVPMTREDFMQELENDLDHHPGNILDPRALLLILLFFGPFFVISYQVSMFAHDLGIRGPDAVKGGDLFKLFRVADFEYGRKTAGAIPEYLMGRDLGGDNAGDPGWAVVFDRLRGRNPERNLWERAIAERWREGNIENSIWDEPYKGDKRSSFQKSSDQCPGLEVASFSTTVQPVDADGTMLAPFQSDAIMMGTYCIESGFFLLLLLMVPFLLLGGFIHMTVGWRRDLKEYVKAALKREMSEAALAVHVEEATQGDRFGGKCCRRPCTVLYAHKYGCIHNLDFHCDFRATVRNAGNAMGDTKGMVGGNNAYHAGWLKRGRALGDLDGDGDIDTVRKRVLTAVRVVRHCS